MLGLLVPVALLLSALIGVLLFVSDGGRTFDPVAIDQRLLSLGSDWRSTGATASAEATDASTEPTSSDAVSAAPNRTRSAGAPIERSASGETRPESRVESRVESPGAIHPQSEAPRARPTVERIGTVAFQPISEISGLVRSQRYPDTWWVHNDSGDEARLFAIDDRGDVIIPPWLRDRDFHGETPVAGASPWVGHRVALAANYDWEDLALEIGRAHV